MSFSNFRNFQELPSGRFVADVDETTGFWFWKKTKTVKVAKAFHKKYWHFMDSGALDEWFEIENLFRAYLSNEELKSIK